MKVLIALFGWFAFNVMKLRIEKDEYDDTGKTFPVKEYVSKNWDNWLWSLCGVPILLFAGQEAFHIINISEDSSLKWGDSYYLAAGFVPELLLFAYVKWRKSKG